MIERDFGNELLAALLAVGVIAFALVFGILLTLSSNPTIIEASPSATLIGRIETISMTALPNTATYTPTVTSTTRPTQPPTLTATKTRLPTLTLTFTHTLSLTPTEERLILPSVTVSASASPRGTATPSHTRTLRPTMIVTRTVAPITPTSTFTPPPSFTPLPTGTSGIRATPTPTFTPIASETPLICVPPAGWVTYIVQSGDTLFSLAQAVGSRLQTLQTANCLANVDRILAGDVLYLPIAPITGERWGCQTSEIAAITQLSAGQRVQGVITLNGTATLDQFWYYKIEVRPDLASVYNFYGRYETPVQNGPLATLDTRIFGRGLHWVRLVVVNLDASTPPEAICVIPLYFNP